MCSKGYTFTTNFSIFQILLIYGNLGQSAPSTASQANVCGPWLASCHWRGQLKWSIWRGSRLLGSDGLLLSAHLPGSISRVNLPGWRHCLPCAVKPTFLQSSLPLAHRQTQQHGKRAAFFAVVKSWTYVFIYVKEGCYHCILDLI